MVPRASAATEARVVGRAHQAYLDDKLHDPTLAVYWSEQLSSEGKPYVRLSAPSEATVA